MAERIDIFISYSRKDGEDFAADLRGRLEAEGLTLWRDRDRMEGGVGWWKQITDALDAVTFMVLVATPEAMQSPVVRKEWRYARQQGVCVYPVQVPGLPIDFDALPRWMRDSHFYTLGKEWETFVNYLKSPCTAPKVPFMPPDLPEHFVPRPREFDALKSQLLDANFDNPVAITTALKGAGGFGKTTLAAALCHDEDVQTAFDDGVLWVTLGENPDIVAALSKLYRALTDDAPGFIDIEEGANKLAERLTDLDCLIVIDDVWNSAHLKPFLRGGARCARLVTTRDAGIAARESAKTTDVDEMTLAESVALLGAGLDGLDPRRLGRIAARLGEWALMLEIANGQLRERVGVAGDTPERALDWLERLLDKRGITGVKRDDDEARKRDAAGVLGGTLALLGDDERKRLCDLAVFKDDENVPLSSVAALWGLDAFDTEDLVLRFAKLSLLRFSSSTGSIRLHDVIREYLGTQVADMPALHARLIDAYGDLTALPDSYAWRNIGYHLREAGKRDKLQGLLTKTDDWIEAKFRALGTYESVVADIDLCLDSYNQNISKEIIATAGLWAVHHIINEIISGYELSRLKTMALIDRYIERNGKRTQEALGIARLKPEPEDRFDCLLIIGEVLGFADNFYDELKQIARVIDDAQTQKQKLSQLEKAIERPRHQQPYMQRRRFSDVKDCVDGSDWDNDDIPPNLMTLVMEISGERFYPEIYRSQEEYLQEILGNEGLYLILTMIENHHISEAIYLVENNKDLGNFLNVPDELFEVAGLLAEQGCQESIKIYEMAEEHIDNYDIRDVALYEIVILLANLNEFDKALQCAHLIQPDLFGDRVRILDFIEKKKADETILDKPDLELWHPSHKIPQALASSQKGIFIGSEGAFKNTGLQRNS